MRWSISMLPAVVSDHCTSPARLSAPATGLMGDSSISIWSGADWLIRTDTLLSSTATFVISSGLRSRSSGTKSVARANAQRSGRSHGQSNWSSRVSALRTKPTGTGCVPKRPNTTPMPRLARISATPHAATRSATNDTRP
jgi:hypothetical protein